MQHHVTQVSLHRVCNCKCKYEYIFQLEYKRAREAERLRGTIERLFEKWLYLVSAKKAQPKEYQKTEIMGTEWTEEQKQRVLLQATGCTQSETERDPVSLSALTSSVSSVCLLVVSLKRKL